MCPCCGVDQLRSHANPVGNLANASLKHVADTEFPADPLDVHRLPLIGKTGVARDHEQAMVPRQRRDDVFHHAVGKIILLWVAAYILERQHGDRWFVRKSKRLRRSC